MNNTKWIILLLCYLLPVALFAQQNQRFTGSWTGKINLGAIQYRFRVNLHKEPSGNLKASLDSPDQKAYGLPTDTTVIDGNKITIMAKNLMGNYVGTMEPGDTLIDGKWNQAGQTFDLILKKIATPIVLKRPQEPKAPFPYEAKDVTFVNEKAKIELAGTLTIPQGKGPFPAVVMVTGSGAHNRNEELMEHKPFLVIADYLTRKGIAVLRYDDRGVEKSKGNFLTSTTYDFADDAEAGLNWLRQQPLIDAKRVGIAGHSEGGIIAPIVASRNKNVKFIILLAGPGLVGEQILLAQKELIDLASGIKPETIKEEIALNKKIFELVKTEPDGAKATNGARKLIVDEINTSHDLSDAEKAQQLKGIESKLIPLGLPWFRTFLMLDPKIYLEKTRCPVLALNGTKDLQVPCKEDLVLIEKYLKTAGNKNYKILPIDGVNHLFQHTATGNPSEYATIEETFAPEALSAMSDFILKLK